jgi:hypothetical protein
MERRKIGKWEKCKHNIYNQLILLKRCSVILMIVHSSASKLSGLGLGLGCNNGADMCRNPIRIGFITSSVASFVELQSTGPFCLGVI